MQIVKPHSIIAKPVKRFKQIAEEADKMHEMLMAKQFSGYYQAGYALAHSQVNYNPFRFFVVIDELVEVFGHNVIINPVITRALDIEEIAKGVVIPNFGKCEEGCLSYPWRRGKSVDRFNRINVKYQTPHWLWGLKTYRRAFTGLASQIMQHEIDHMNAITLFTKQYGRLQRGRANGAA